MHKPKGSENVGSDLLVDYWRGRRTTRDHPIVVLTPDGWGGRLKGPGGLPSHSFLRRVLKGQEGAGWRGEFSFRVDPISTRLPGRRVPLFNSLEECDCALPRVRRVDFRDRSLATSLDRRFATLNEGSVWLGDGVAITDAAHSFG
jgi:hypothetical protein